MRNFLIKAVEKETRGSQLQQGQFHTQYCPAGVDVQSNPYYPWLDYAGSWNPVTHSPFIAPPCTILRREVLLCAFLHCTAHICLFFSLHERAKTSSMQQSSVPL